MCDLVDGVSDYLPEIGDESGQRFQLEMAKCNGKCGRIQEAKEILTALAFMGELVD